MFCLVPITSALLFLTSCVLFYVQRGVPDTFFLFGRTTQPLMCYFRCGIYQIGVPDTHTHKIWSHNTTSCVILGGRCCLNWSAWHFFLLIGRTTEWTRATWTLWLKVLVQCSSWRAWPIRTCKCLFLTRQQNCQSGLLIPSSTFGLTSKLECQESGRRTKLAGDVWLLLWLLVAQ